MGDSKSLRAAFLAFLPFLLSAIFAVRADVPDLTASMENLCNPNASRWDSSQMFSRAVTSICVHDGLLFVSGGDWNKNSGPCPIFAVNPYTGSYRNEWDAGTECVNYYRKGSDGCVYVPSIDPKDGNANCCDVSRRNPDGTWTKLNIAPNRWLYYSSSENAAYGTHTWDVAIWKGKIFTAGYGIGVGPEKTTSRLSDATPQLTNANRVYASAYGGTFQSSRRFEAFLPFDDDLFAYPLNYASVQSANFRVWDFEEWRFDESTSKFVCQTNSASNVVPGLKASDYGLFSSSYYSTQIQLWNPTKFKGRILYIPGSEHGTTKPVAALYSATNINHSVRATRVEFGSGVYPFDIFARDDVVLVVTAQYDSAKSNVVNSVWASSDGVSFVKKFFFSAPQHASAMAYLDGSYYFAMGTRTTVSTAWTLKGSDVAGQIYRIRDPNYADAIQVVAENATVSVPEGGTAAARFKLAAQPSAAVTASVHMTGGSVPAVTALVASVTFTPQDWNTWHEVTVAAAEDDREETSSATLFCGVGNPAALRATSITVTPVNNDPVGLTRASTGGIYTNSASHATYGVKGAFDHNRSDTNGRWLASKADHMYVVYKFNEATAANMLRVWNGSNSGGGASSAERSPKAWTFEASNDGETWTTLDTRTNETGWSASGEQRDYTFTNDTAYLYYKFDCTELCSTNATYLQLWELEFYCIEGGSGTGGGDNPGGGDEPGPEPKPTSEVLVYEGFHSSDYSFAAAYSSDAPVLKETNPVGQNIGFDADNAWSSGTAVPRTISGSLTLGASFDIAESNGTGRVVMQNGGTEARGRGIQRKFSAALPSSGTIYCRFLMKLNSNVNNYLSTLQSGGYWAGGLVKSAFNGGQDAMQSLTTDGIWMGYKKTTVGGTAAISLFARIGETDYLLPFNTASSSPLLSTWSTYIFVAKIDIGAGSGGKDRVSVAAQPIATGVYSEDWEWNVTNIEANVVSGGTPVSYIAFAGQYQTGNYEVAIDQFKIATSLDLVCNHTASAVVVPSPVFGGEGVPAPAFGVDQSSGNPVFTFSIGNAVKGAKYRIYKTESLTVPFEPYGDVIEADANGILDFVVPTADEPSCFFKIVTE